MLSYKDWKIVNESVAGGALGLSQVQSLGIMGANTMTEEEMLAEMRKRLNEAKKKMKKKMGFGGGSEESEPEGEGDGEMVPPKEKKDRDPDADEKAAADSEDGDDHDDHDDEDEDHDGDEKPDMDDEEKPDMPEKKVRSDDEMDAEGDATEMMMKKKMKKGGKCEKCHKDPCVCKKGDKGKCEKCHKDPCVCKKEKKEKKKLTKEQSEWLNSVKSMLNNDSIALSGLPEPTAGQYGYSPVQYIGLK